MMRGITKFRCPKCGHIFEAPDIEDNASVRTMPQPCPKCGTKSNVAGLFDLLGYFISKVLK